MSKLEIRLRNAAGNTEVYTCEFIPARKYIEYFELEEWIVAEQPKATEIVPKRLDFVASLFPKVTVDKLYDGLSTHDLPLIIQEVMMAILGGGDDSDPKVV